MITRPVNMMILEKAMEGIDHIGIVVSDLDQAIDFYTRHLAFTLIARYEPGNNYHNEIAYLQFPGESQAKLELYSLKNRPDGQVTYERRIGLREIALRVPDVNRELDRLKSSGVEVDTEPSFAEAANLPKDSPVKRRTRAAIKAPDGVIIGLYSWG